VARLRAARACRGAQEPTVTPLELRLGERLVRLRVRVRVRVRVSLTLA